jgi:hypothetical protein
MLGVMPSGRIPLVLLNCVTNQNCGYVDIGSQLRTCYLTKKDDLDVFLGILWTSLDCPLSIGPLSTRQT